MEPIQQGQQILMIANELNRAQNWIEKPQFNEVNLTYERAMKLMDITISDNQCNGKLKNFAVPEKC